MTLQCSPRSNTCWLSMSAEPTSRSSPPGKSERREFPSGPALTARQMVSDVKKLARGLEVRRGVDRLSRTGAVDRPVAEPHNLGPRLGRIRLRSGVRLPVKVINDAAMQALGSYKGGKMLFLGLGTGLGSTHDRGRHRGADGTRPPALQEEHLRGLCRPARAWNATARRRWRRACRRRRGPPGRGARTRRCRCSAAATPRSSKSCRRVAARATTPMRSSADFACGKDRLAHSIWTRPKRRT